MARIWFLCWFLSMHAICIHHNFGEVVAEKEAVGSASSLPIVVQQRVLWWVERSVPHQIKLLTNRVRPIAFHK